MDVVIDISSGEILGQLVTPDVPADGKVHFLSKDGYGWRPAWQVRIEFR